MNNLLFTSDSHFFHKPIIEHCKRPFKSMEEMHEVLIKNWNNKVRDNDEVYHLGDFSWGNLKHLEEVYSQLKGIKHIIPGNHDNLNKLEKVFGEKYVHWGFRTVKCNGARFLCCHYNMRRWPGQRKGYIHLFGHSHGRLTETEFNCMDVSVDSNSFEPIHMDEIMDMRSKYGL